MQAVLAAVLCLVGASCAMESRQLTDAELARFRDVDWSKSQYRLQSGGPPEQIHIAYAGKSERGYPTGVSIGWVFAEDKVCSVRYGTNAGNLTETTGDVKGKQYVHTGAYHYHVEVLGLREQTRYHYEVDCGGKVSEVYGFVTAPDSYTLDRPYHINIFGDKGWLGSAERPMVISQEGLKKNWSAVPVHTLQEKMFGMGEVDMMWVVGDIAYADDAFAHDVVGGLYEKCMDGFVKWHQGMAANIPFHVTVGNHEAECHSPECVLDVFLGKKLANFSAYNARWQMPSRASGGVLNMWYSWNVGPVHFISLNTETDFEGAGEEKKAGAYAAGGFGDYMGWLEADLQQAYRDKKSGKRPFIVAGGHRSCKHGCSPSTLQALFDKYEVDLFVGGHAHAYARSVQGCAGPACKLEHNATYPTSYIFSGASGSDETEFITTGPTANSTIGTFATSELSTGYLSIMNRTTLRWRLLSAFASNRVIDEFWVHAQE